MKGNGWPKVSIMQCYNHGRHAEHERCGKVEQRVERLLADRYVPKAKQCGVEQDASARAIPGHQPCEKDASEHNLLSAGLENRHRRQYAYGLKQHPKVLDAEKARKRWQGCREPRERPDYSKPERISVESDIRRPAMIELARQMKRQRADNRAGHSEREKHGCPSDGDFAAGAP